MLWLPEIQKRNREAQERYEKKKLDYRETLTQLLLEWDLFEVNDKEEFVEDWAVRIMQMK